MKVRTTTISSGIVACLLALMAQQAGANTTTTFSLSVGNSAISPYPAPYGSVLVDLNTAGTIATITFTGGSSAPYTYLFGGAQAIDVNVNGAFAVVPGSITGMSSPGVGSGNADGFGSFNLTIDNFDGAGHAATPMSFQISGSWANASSVLTPNAGGSTAAAHIFVFNAAGSVVQTGYAGNGTTTDVPDGGTTVLMLGTALAGLGILKRRIG